MAALLTAQGFEVHTKEDLDADRLGKTIHNFLNQYGAGKKNRDNRLLVFYSGHGDTRTGWRGQNGYIIPTDSPQQSRDDRGFLDKALSMDDIVNWSEKVATKHILFLFDSCFSGSILMTKKGGEKIPENIKASIRNPVRQFITAGGANETVPGESEFVKALILGLQYKQADYTHDGYVTGTELAMYLKNQVENKTRPINHPQEGKLGNHSDPKGDFVFMLAAGIEDDRSSSDDVVVPPPPRPPSVKTGFVQITVYADEATVRVKGINYPLRIQQAQRVAAGKPAESRSDGVSDKFDG